MIRTLLTGGSGTLGTALQPKLRGDGHAVRAASRSPPPDTGAVEWVSLDLTTGDGIPAAMADIDVVIHTASAPAGDSEAVDVAGTKRLLAAASEAGVEHFLYISIVGIEDIPFSYYQHKLAAERAIEENDMPWTILRATQFHEFIDEIFGRVASLPVWPLPTNAKCQPIAVDDVAEKLCRYATTEAHGRVDPLGGPEVHTLGSMARSYNRARGMRRAVLRLPIPGKTMGAFRAGNACCPAHANGNETWDEWLERTYGTQTEDRSEPVGVQS